MGRAFGAHGADGVEYMEPLSFKGRKGSGLPGGRDAYRDASLRAAPRRLAQVRVHVPALGPARLRARTQRPRRGAGAAAASTATAAEAIESGLARASRILPLVTQRALSRRPPTTTTGPRCTATCRSSTSAHPGSYSDTPAPKVFGAVSSLDPQLFASVDEYADALAARRAAGARSRRSRWRASSTLWAESSAADLARADAPARATAAIRATGASRSTVAIAAGIGRFFARKLRAGVLSASTTAPATRAPATRRSPSTARPGRLGRVRRSGPAQAYVADVTFGFDAHLRGHWQDRLAAIDRDIAAVEARRRGALAAGGVDQATLERAVAAVLVAGCPGRRSQSSTPPPVDFRPGEAITLSFRVSSGADAVRLLSPAPQPGRRPGAELETARDGEWWRAAVPADDTHSPYPIQYYLALRSAQGFALWPGFAADFTGQPYRVVRRSA